MRGRRVSKLRRESLFNRHPSLLFPH
eukprot:UN00183